MRKGEKMSTFAKTYIASVVALGFGLLAAGLIQWKSEDPARFITFLLFGVLAATWKVKLPGITGTISGSFLFILIGVAAFSFSETAALAALVALVQCVWRAKKKPVPVQVAFNIATLSASAGAAWFGAHAISQKFAPGSLILVLVPAACIFLVCDTAMVSGVIALVEQKNFLAVWRECHGWSFPYYLLGAALAALITVCGRATGWISSLFIVPASYLIYAYVRFYIEKASEERMHVQVNDHDHEMVVSTR
jgi:hypothetical protein